MVKASHLFPYLVAAVTRQRPAPANEPRALRRGLLAAMPVLVLVMYLEILPLAILLLIPGVNDAVSLFATAQVLVVLSLLAAGYGDWRWGHLFLAAPLLGIAITYGLTLLWTFLAEPWRLSGLHVLAATWFPVTPVRGQAESLSSWLVVGPWVVVGLVFGPVLAVLRSWGGLSGCLALLGGVGMLTVYYWADNPPSLAKLLVYLAACGGLAVFAIVPRRWRTATAWLVLLGDWVLVALGKWFFIVYETPHAMSPEWRAAHLPTLEGVWAEMPLAGLALSLALLLSLQLLARRHPVDVASGSPPHAR
ncbi:MAG: hypothetical protein ACYC1C_02765 [Chloroflexota bacterium]